MRSPGSDGPADGGCPAQRPGPVQDADRRTLAQHVAAADDSHRCRRCLVDDVEYGIQTGDFQNASHRARRSDQCECLATQADRVVDLDERGQPA